MSNQTWDCTPWLRWVSRWRHTSHPLIGNFVGRTQTVMEEYKVLQQAWVCRETGKTEWQDVPMEDEDGIL